MASSPVVPIAAADWTPELQEDLRLALEAFPPAARAFPGGPLEIELHAEATPLGWGDASHPAFTDGLRRLHLYAFQNDDDPRASWRLERLTPEEQQRLWRRRAIVHAVIRRWDERLRWSSRPTWEQLMGWRSGQPLIIYPWAFSRRLGMQSPALDLATFAEELLVPAESIRPDAVTADDRVRCRELSKSQFLDERLTGLDASWQPRRSCPSFEAWSDPAGVTAFEVGFAAPSNVGAQSLFGHLFLTVLRGEDVPLEEQEALQLAALMSPLEPKGLSYLAKGVVGGYRGVFSLTTMADVLHESLELEQRSIRRFRLELTAPQRLRMLERIWELERTGYVDYRFLDANCASMLRFLIAPALGEGELGRPMTPWETPTQVLEALGPALAIPQIEEPSGERSRRLGAVRRALVKHASSEEQAALGEAWPKVQRLDVVPGRERAEAYAALAVAPDAWRARVLLSSLRIERHALDLASVSRIRTERSTVLAGWKWPTTDELIATRQQRYQKDVSPRRRASDELGELLALDELLRSAPRRPFEPWELATLAAEKDARETFDAASDAVASLPEDVLSAALEEERTLLRQSNEAAGRRAVPESGYGYGYAGVGLLSSRVPVLRLEAALLREELGDQRQRGFGGRGELRVLDGAVDVSSNGIHRGSLIVAGGRALADNGWGWGGQLDYGFASGAHEVAAQIERLWGFLADERLTNFLLAAGGLRLGVRVDSSVSAALYPRLGLASRIQLPGSFGNSLRLEAGYTPQLLLGSKIVFQHGVAARAQLSVRLGAAKGFALSARADVEVEWRPGAVPVALGSLGIGVD